MADDFGEFAAFSSAFPSTSTTTTSNNTQVSGAKADGTQGVVDKADNFFTSFPSGDQPSNNVQFSFDFGEQLEGITSGGGFVNFDITSTNIADIHIPLDLPSPPAMDVHMAGGVPFDIPPMPLSPSEESTTTATTTFSVWPQTIDNGSQSVIQHVDDTQSNSFSNVAPTNTTSTVPKFNSETNFEGALTVENSHLTVDGLSSATHAGTKVKEEDEFGNFESSLTFRNSKTTSSTQNASVETNTTGTSGIQLSLSNDPLKKSSFGSFVADSKSRTQTEEDLTFGSCGTVTTLNDSNIVEEEKKTEASQFADFRAFQQTSNQTQQQESGANSDFGDFEAFANSSGTKEENNSQFAEFGGFSAFKQASVSEPVTKGEKSSSNDFEMSRNKTENSMESQTRHTGQVGKTNGLEFTKFESAPSRWGSADKDSTTKDTTGRSGFTADFATFESTTTTTSSAMSDEFGGFSAFTGQTTSSHTDTEFGDFSGAKGDNTFTGDAATKNDDNFGEFNSGSKKADFGDFSSSSSTFGDFSNAPAAPPPAQQVTTGAVKTVKANPVLTACFTGTGSQQSLQVPAPTSLFQRLLKEQQCSDLQGMWQVLQKCVDFTVPLHKWNNSYMQGSYYEALKIDPVLASKPGVLPILAGGMATFEAPLGGATAAEDLMEAFGFQGDLEVSPTARREFRMGSPGAPALLDLSLPATPTSPTNKDSFTLAKDLLGLDLNPQQQTQTLSSVEELVRNERLVVSKSTWVDSKLLELGGESSVPSETTSSSNSRPSTPRSGKKQNSVEFQLLQLGLDVSKTTFTSGSSNGELSLSARSLLGRLPDLTFMLASEEIVHSTYYSHSK